MSESGGVIANVIDKTRDVRAGEELDAAKLEAWLLPHLSDQGGLSGPLIIEQFPSGHSNLTYLVRAATGHGPRELVLRRPPFGSKVKTAHDMAREYRILSHLHPVYAPAPRPLAYCDDLSVMGSPFYVMERIVGVVLRRAVPASVDLSPPSVKRLCEALIDNLAALHAVDYVKAGLGDLGRPDGYVERQVSGWTKRYGDARTDDIPDIDQIAAWLAARIPAHSGAALIHNDYKYDNVVLDPSDITRIIGVLDWEMSTVGDPLMDLGTTLGYWVEAGDSQSMKLLSFGPTDRPGSLTRRELAARYAEKSGRPVENLLFYYCFALFKTAVVLQQIYRRYHDGLTKDARFAGLIAPIRILAAAAVESAGTGRV